jgi:hypothetical protein
MNKRVGTEAGRMRNRAFTEDTVSRIEARGLAERQVVDQVWTSGLEIVVGLGIKTGFWRSGFASHQIDHLTKSASRP